MNNFLETFADLAQRDDPALGKSGRPDYGELLSWLRVGEPKEPEDPPVALAQPEPDAEAAA